MTTTKYYAIGKYEIECPRGHALQLAQRSSKLYDRFLPVLAKFIDSDSTIIDVGANIGDTAYSIVQNCNNPIICIEPSEVFFPYLQRNLSRLPIELSSKVKAYQHLVGTGLVKGGLKHDFWGTAKLDTIDNSTINNPIGLDSIVQDIISDIILLKVDTDGFDYDVIQSASETIKQHQPLLFWENEISEDFQYEGYTKMYSMLRSNEYEYLYIFDNSGNVMLEESTFIALEHLNYYIYSQKKYDCKRTIYYTDVLATTKKNLPMAKKAIEYYKLNLIQR